MLSAARHTQMKHAGRLYKINSMARNILLYGVCAALIVYLAIGAAFYLQDRHYSRSGIHLCPLGTPREQMENCPQQTVNIQEDWSSALTMTVGWLPLIVAHGINNR